MMVKWVITTLLNGGNWTISGGKPVIKEYQPLGARRPKAGQLDPHFKSLIKFQRIIIIQLADLTREGQGFQRKNESPDTMDVFELSIKTKKYSDTEDILKNLREILISQPTSGQYSVFNFGDLEPNPQRGRFIHTVEVQALYAGKVRDAG